MAVAPEVLEAGAGAAESGATAGAAAGAARRPRSSPADYGRTAGAVWSRVPSGPAPVAGTITKLIWAAAIGLIVLEVASLATGQFWSFNLPGLKAAPAKLPYQPLYSGQQTQQVPLAFVGTLPQQTSDTNLSGRSGGNLAMP